VTLLPIFVDSQYEIRSGWKFTAYSVLLVGLFIATGMVVPVAVAVVDPTWLLVSRDDIRFLAMNAVVLFVPSMGALFVMARLVDSAPLATFGVTFHERWLRDLGVGLAVAAAMVLLAIGGALPFGRVHIEWNGSAAGLPAIGATVLVLSLAAFNEELVFRGYPFQVFLRGIGVWPAMLLISFIWAMLHSRNDGATVLSTLNTMIAGVFLSWAYMRTRSIWLPYGIHVGWNVGTAVVMGVPVSGIDTASILKTQLQAPAIISGGIYGPENSILGTAVFVLGVIVIRRFRVGAVSPEVQQALTQHRGFVATALPPPA
jgi:membrane protease YdiL (CAAX protease family)